METADVHALFFQARVYASSRDGRQTSTPTTIAVYHQREPQALKIPTWITLRQVQEEFMGVAKEIALGLREVLGIDESNDGIKDLRFCVGLSTGGGWEHSV